MTPDQFFTDGRSDFIKREMSRLGCDFGVKDGLEEEIAEFIDNFLAISRADRRRYFVGFFNEVFHEALMRLFGIPRAAARCSQEMHDLAEPIHGG